MLASRYARFDSAQEHHLMSLYIGFDMIQESALLFFMLI